MTECPNLCTAEKCQELENRIYELEQIVEQLKEINVSGIVTNNDLQITIANAFNQDTETIDMYPFALDVDLQKHIDTKVNDSGGHSYDSTINLDGSVANKKLFLTVSTDNDSDTATIDLPFVNQEDFDSHVKTKVNDSGGHSYNSTININGSYQSETLYLTVATQDDVDTATILIPLDQTINSYLVNTMNCDLSPTLTAIENCCEKLVKENNQNQALLDSLYYLIELRTGQIESGLQQILEEFNLSLDGSIEIGESILPKDGEDNPKTIGYYEYESSEDIPYNGKTFIAINQALELLDQKITAVHKDVVKGIEMPFSIPNLLPEDCESDEEEGLEVLVETIDNGLELYNNPKQQEEIQLKKSGAFQSFIVGTAFDFLVDEAIDWLGDKIIKNVPVSQVTAYLTQVLLEEHKTNKERICLLQDSIKNIDPELITLEDYALRPDAGIPRLAIIFRPENKEIKSGNYVINIPHYGGKEAPIIPSYKKGNSWARIILKDNSQMVINADSKSVAKFVLQKLLGYVNPAMKTDNWKYGEHPKKPYKVFRVVPYRADYYEKGKLQQLPTWRHYF